MPNIPAFHRQTAARIAAALLLLSGCAVVADRPSRMDLVWLADGHVYVLRDQESGRQVWRRDGDQEALFARGRDIPGACGGVSWIFDARDRLGIVLDCGEFQRLVAYTPASGQYQNLYDVPAVGEVAIRPDGQGGYLSKAVGGCWSLGTVGPMLADALAALTRFTCEQGGSAKAPNLLPNGDLLFVAIDANAAQQPVRDDDRTWHIYRLAPGAPTAQRIGPDLIGFPEMDVTPDGNTAVVALWGKDTGGLVAVDLATGDDRWLAKFDDSVTSPAVSPTGDAVMYIDDLSKVETVKLQK
jgi:hypothetical protein